VKQTMGFQTEVKQLLQLMIHSLYSNREIFLRELISNASDACDKLRFEALNNGDLYEGDGDLAVELGFDKAKRTITIRDNGIGMTYQEVIDNLGTIARSGTKEFFGKLSGDEGKDSQLIGQFGVGFYSAFIVAANVIVTTRKTGAAAAEGVRWESDGSGEFSIETVEQARRGTEIVLQLRENKDEESFDDLLSQWTLKSIVEKYSDHISLPIKMLKQEWDKDASEYKQTGEWEVANQATALWARSKAEVTEEQYQSFYTHISHDSAKPLAYSHNRVEGRTEYTQLLFIPGKAPFDLYDRQAKHGLKLYVKRVFIMDDAEQLLPSYLRFVRGVIDSADLPLNVSREILQESRDVKAIREGCSKRVLSMLEDMAENRSDDYTSFWNEFGQVLKEGLGEDFGNKERIAKLLRFMTTNTGTDASVALATYVSNMKPEQEKIYYVTADSETGARNSPHLEVFRTKGIEVLLLTDRVDEWMLNHLQEFEGKQLVSVARGDLDLGKLASEEDKAKTEQVNEAFKPLVESLQEALKDKVKEVRISSRLTDSPACLISDDGDMSGHLERLLKQAGQKAPDRKPILEINPDHALVKNIKAGSDSVGDWAHLLFDQATLAEGGQLEDPAAFVKRVNHMLLAGVTGTAD
jgi:molecular chaperone HtpG